VQVLVIARQMKLLKLGTICNQQFESRLNLSV
jgi:hypothetical protein